MMKANELQETKTLVDIDDTYPEEIVVEGEGGFEYGLSREEERGLIGFIRNLTSPTRREVIKPEKTVYRQKVDAPAGEYTKEYIPAEYGEEEVSLDYAPAVRGTRAAFEYAKSLFGSQETRDEAIAALKQAPEAVEKSMKDQMTAALGMTQGAESVVTREGEEITFDPLAVPATMVPGGIAARAAATEGSTVLGIFGGKKGKSFAEREAAFEKAVNDGLKDEANLPDSWKGDEQLSKMLLDQDVFEASGGAFRAEDGLLKYEIPTRNVRLKTIKEGGVFEDIGGVRIAGSPIDDDTVIFSDFAFQELKDKKGLNNPITLKDVIDFPELFDEYPALSRVKFRVEDLPPGSGAYYNPLDESGRQAIVVDRQIIAKKEVLKSILHELQHAVDHVEDRQFGASVQAYLPRNASSELDKIAMSARIATQTLEGSFPPEKFGNLYPDANNYKALRGLSHEDARTIDLVRKLNSPELIEDMRARNPNPESHAGRLIEAYDSMDDMQRILFKLYDEKMGDKYKELTEIYQEAQRKYLSTPGEVDARNVEDRFDRPDEQIGGDNPMVPVGFKDTDDMGRIIEKDMSLTGGEDVDDISFKSEPAQTEADRIQIRAEGGPEAGTPEAIAEEKALNAAIADAKTKNDGEQYKEFFEEEAAVNYLVELPDNKKAQAKKDWDEVKTVEQVDNWFKKYDAEPDTVEAVDDISFKQASPLQIGTSPAAEGGKLLANYTADTAKDLVEKAKSAKVGLNPELIGKKADAGKQVAIRLNLNSSIPDAPKGLDKLQTVHDKRPTGTALSYLPFATVENVEFFVNQTGRRDIASKIKGLAVKEAKNKFPAMSVNGQFNPTRNVLEEMGDDVVEVGFNPANTHLFVDMATGQAVKSADVATVIGNRVYAKGVTYMKKAEAPEPKAASDGTELGSEVRYKFKRGGLMARK